MQLGDLTEDTRVADLGAGNGILGIGCRLAGASSVELIEIDATCIHDAYADDVTWHNIDVQEWDGNNVDLIVMNPPWGVQIQQADRPFLEAAFSSNANVIHCLHNRHATHLSALARDRGWQSEEILTGLFSLPPSYEHHTARDATTEVSVWRFMRD